MRADDALKYAAALLRDRADWTLDAIGGAGCDTDHEVELDATDEIIQAVADLAAQFGDPNRYSDGRYVKTSAWIEEDRLSTSHIWHPNPGSEAVRSHRSGLPSGGPDLPSPGVYEVTTDPSTQGIHVRVVRIAGAS